MKVRKEIKKFYTKKKLKDGREIIMMKDKPWEALMEALMNDYKLTKVELADTTHTSK
jgi:hypothetical protein